MKVNGFHASASGGKKAMAIALVLAMVLASISVIGALAAPGQKSGAARAFGSQLRELDADAAWFNSARLNAANFVKTSDPGKAQQYLSEYAFALGQAETIVRNGGTSTTNNNNNNSSNDRSAAQQNLASWLHMMAGLRAKLVGIGFSNGISNISNVASAGVPVTGNTSSSNNSSSSSSGTSSSALPTATPGTGSSSSSSSSSATATPTATPGTSSSSSSSSNTGNSTSSNGAIPNTGQNAAVDNAALEKIWGGQFRELEADQVWLSHFKSNPANFVSTSDLAKLQQWVSQYEFALRQADAIVTGRGTNVTSNNNGRSNSSSSSNNNSTNFGSAQGDLAQWLHMMRDLQMKLTSGTNGVNGS